MSIHFVLIIVGLLVIAIVFASVDSGGKKNKSIRKSIALGASKVISDVAIGLIITAIPTAILFNHLKPQPEDVMPVFISSGTYAELDDADPALVEEMIDACTADLVHTQSADVYFDRASLYFETSNLDLAYSDLLKCVELEENWIYYYDLGVVAGYLLDYGTAIDYFETALSMDIPISERGLVRNTMTMIEGYYGSWMHSLIK